MLPLYGLLSWLLAGLGTGALARLVLPGTPRLGLAGALLAGLVGGFLGGVLATAIGYGGLASFDPRSLTTACLAALLCLLLLRAAKL